MSDPFEEARREKGILECNFQGEVVPMILRHEEVRKAAKDWRTFSSDAPFRVPIPSEEEVRSMRQLPIETDPPQHTEYRRLVEPFFARAKNPEVIARVDALIGRLIHEASRKPSVEIVREFALPLQSHALTYLLNVPEAVAHTWISWGIHVFKDGHDGQKKGAALENYLNSQFDMAHNSNGEDFFSTLSRAQIQGRQLSREEMLGYANLTFAGGRDTIIHTISSVFAWLAENPDAMEFLKHDPSRIIHAGEEFFRVISPLTHIGRVCPSQSQVLDSSVPAGGRVSLCWASANMDENVFENPGEVKLDRKPNPHLTFGFGAHLCIGAPHARLILRTLLQHITQSIQSITILNAVPRVEVEQAYTRSSAFESLEVALLTR